MQCSGMEWGGQEGEDWGSGAGGGGGGEDLYEGL